MPFNASIIKTFAVPGDATNTYAMIDAVIVERAKEGLTDTQKATIDSYVWTPTTEVELAATPVWAGLDPVPVYFRTTETKMKSALAKWWVE